MIVLGIDHAVSSYMGYGVVDSIHMGNDIYVTHGLISAHNISYPKNMTHMVSKFSLLVKEYRPGLVVFEDQKDNRGFEATQKLHEVQGALKVFCVQNHIPFLSIPPTTMKKIVAGNGWAGKDEVAQAVAKTLGVEYNQIISTTYYKQGSKKGMVKGIAYDASDALGLIVAWRTFLRVTGGHLSYDGK